MINNPPLPGAPFNFETDSGARFLLGYFHHGSKSESNLDFYDGLRPDELAIYALMSPADRAAHECLTGSRISRHHAVPATEELFYLSDDGIPDTLLIANIEPAHKMSETIERADILFLDGARAYGVDWSHRHVVISHRPVVICREGEFLLGFNKALSFALDGQQCALIDAGADAPYHAWGWERALRRHELIRP